jgi:hypothetical protein
MILSAATDSTASAMTRIFHVLAKYPDVQEKLRAEILGVPDQLDHDTLVALPYLDGVVREVLRLCVHLLASVPSSLNSSVHRYPTASPVMYREYVHVFRGFKPTCNIFTPSGLLPMPSSLSARLSLAWMERLCNPFPCLREPRSTSQFPQ